MPSGGSSGSRDGMERNEQAAVLAALSGALLVAIGYSGARGWYRFFEMLRDFFGDRPFLVALAYVFAALGSLGGILVLAGGFLIHKDHVRKGRLLILLGSGAGFFSLLLFLLANLRREEFSYLFHVLPAVVGVGLGIAARLWARPTPMT